jgi:hypothetical protein
MISPFSRDIMTQHQASFVTIFPLGINAVGTGLMVDGS